MPKKLPKLKRHAVDDDPAAEERSGKDEETDLDAQFDAAVKTKPAKAPASSEASESPTGTDASATASAKADAAKIRTEALELVGRHVKWAAAAGAVPLPFVDIIAIAGVELKMLAALSDHYGVPFSEQRGRALILTLLGSVAPHTVGFAISSVFIKALPLAGVVLGLASSAAVAGSATSIMGELFVDHLEIGGDIHDVDAAGMGSKFRQAYTQPQA